MNDLVKYHNDLNMVSMKKWSAEDMNFFFGIISKIRNQGTKEMTLNTDEIKDLIDYSNRNYRWVATLDKITDKIAGLRYVERTSKRIANFALFQRFIIDIENKTLNVKVSDDFEYIVNKLTKNFTVYELTEFTSLKSVYSKTMYRILKQWRTTGSKEFKLDQFKDLLDVPVSYKANDIKKRVIKPIEKELPKYFNKFNVKIIKANTQGTPVIGYKFTWNPEKVPEKPEFVDDEYIKKTSKNRNISKIKNKKSKGSFSQKAREERFKRILEDREQGEEQ